VPGPGPKVRPLTHGRTSVWRRLVRTIRSSASRQAAYRTNPREASYNSGCAEHGPRLMRIAFGSDHAGFELKNQLMPAAAALGHEIVDVGAFDASPSDYPDFAESVARAVLDGHADRGVLICGSGVGASVAANKIPGIRAGLCHDTYSAHQGVEHDDTNVLVMGSRIVGSELAKDLMRVFLEARYSGGERHRRRVGKIGALERKYESRR
jgi:ribose 5-phosphate isomerase B